MTTTTELARPQSEKMIAGVCAGLAARYGWKVRTVRLLFVLSCLLPGPQFIAYIALWILMPKRP
jgi:phage shock protein PspC (stress-responsive transcriptional regulator)